MIKNITFYSNYYYPELASLAQLTTDLCSGLADEYEITVICAVPCYSGAVEKKYLEKKYYFEVHDNVNIIRVKVPPYNKRNKLSRIKNIVVYFFRSIYATVKAPKADCVITESQPPVLGGLLGVIGKYINRMRGKNAKMMYVIQDYNPEQTMIVGYSKNRMVLSLMMLLDKFSCKNADKVVVVGKDMLPTMTKRFTNKKGIVSKKMPKMALIHNWIDESAIYPLDVSDRNIIDFKEKHGLSGKFIIMYSGNIGLFYDLENLIRVIDKFKNREDVVFTFVGDGAKKEYLKIYTTAFRRKNVVFIPYQSKEELIYSLNAADVHWIVNAQGVKGVSCPSKLYGILAAAKPALAVLEEGTEARDIIESVGCGYAASPKDYEKIAELIGRFIDTPKEELSEMGKRGHEYLLDHLTKEHAIELYKKEIMAMEDSQ